MDSSQKYARHQVEDNQAEVADIKNMDIEAQLKIKKELILKKKQEEEELKMRR